jgi:Skp family chaperone for outer membrane proteins
VIRRLLLAALVVTLWAVSGTSALAQGIAIIDMKYIFDEYLKFKAMTEEMKASVEAAETDLKGRGEQINKLAKQLKALRADSPEYKQLDEQITKMRVELQTDMSVQKKRFLESEAKIYYTVYNEISQEVKAYAEAKRLILVLRFNGDPINEASPDEIAKQLNKAVVYHHPSIDITPIILGALNQRYQAMMTRPKGNSGVAPRPR